MKLIDLDPNWVGAGGEGITRNGLPVPRRDGVGISFNCPCGSCGNEVYIGFKNPLDGLGPYDSVGPLWDRQGNNFEILSVTPSIQRIGGCEWHGYITNGELIKV